MHFNSNIQKRKGNLRRKNNDKLQANLKFDPIFTDDEGPLFEQLLLFYRDDNKIELTKNRAMCARATRGAS